MINTGLILFSIAIMCFFAVSGVEVWRASGAYDESVSREYYKTRGLSIVIEGVVRVVMLWTAVHIYRLVIGDVNGNPSFESAWVVGAIVTLLVGLEVLAKSLVALGSSLPGDLLVEATDLSLARFRLFVYPIAMAFVAYLVMRFRSWWATGAMTIVLSLTNGVMLVGIILLALEMMNQGDFREPPPKLKEDIQNYLDFDVSRVSVNYSSTEVNAYADALGNIRVLKPIMDLVSHRGLMGIIGHEVGHIKMNHVPRNVATSIILTVVSGVAAVIALRFGTPAARLIGMPDNRVAKTSAGFVMFMVVEPMMRIIAAAIMSVMSVYHEYEADDFSGKTLGPGPIVEGLSTIGDLYGMSKRQPLAHSFPTHPPTRSRIETLKKLEGTYPDKL